MVKQVSRIQNSLESYKGQNYKKWRVITLSIITKISFFGSVYVLHKFFLIYKLSPLAFCLIETSQVNNKHQNMCALEVWVHY